MAVHWRGCSKTWEFGSVCDCGADPSLGDVLRNYAAWERSLEVDRAVREGFLRRYGRGYTTAMQDSAREGGMRLSDLFSIIDVWREWHHETNLERLRRFELPMDKVRRFREERA